ncbi:nucleotidyltransferase domain-containing protein [Phyllobacterium sophorae]|uniref:nucleotidyltransferase domain-containing protein n=1 Tax=Phyllobacterium sophorae TaxID=1520277 RepID=UPI001AECB5B8|nr:nucleotidyltransferase domain-containing protein [Phyllobacterium sophorae]
MARPKPQSAIRFPLSSVFGTEANVRVLRELSRHRGQLDASTLVKRTKLTLPSVLSAISTLVEFGILDEAGSGRSRLFSMNRISPFNISILSLFDAEESRFKGVIEAVKECAASLGNKVIAAWIYGSVARGEDRAQSDLDVLLIAHEEEVASVQSWSVDFLLAKGEALLFSPSVNTLSLADIRRLMQNNDPMWQAIVNDALVLNGLRPTSIFQATLDKKVPT